MTGLERVRSNPFYVLGVRPEHGVQHIEREGQRLIAMLGVGLAEASTYATPMGEFPRDDAMVRQALEQLRDPAERARHAAWATLPAQTELPPLVGSDPRWVELLTELGWR